VNRREQGAIRSVVGLRETWKITMTVNLDDRQSKAGSFLKKRQENVR
jgi:hypothetical protein